MKIFIRTTNERALDESIKRELGDDFTLLIDLEHNSGKAFVKQLDIINEYDSVVLEDDVILCKDFKKRIEEVINTYPNELINFFTQPTTYFPTKKLSFFCYNQCVYFPKGFAKLIKDTLCKYNIDLNRQEVIMRESLNKLKLKHLCYRPCLVQHIDKGSLMNHNPSFCRRSPFFIDYLEELNIPYENSGTKENYRKLFDLMKEKFKDVI